MNPMAILKGSKVFVIAGVAFFALWMINDYRNDQIAQTDALIKANATAVSAESKAQTYKVANAQLEAVAATQAAALVAAAEAREEINNQFVEIRNTQQEQTQVLEGDRLQRAVRGKRELVERLANKATEERFDEVENIFNGT